MAVNLAYEVCGFRVTDVLDLLAAGLSFEEILEEMPDLETEDIVAFLQFATIEKGASNGI